MSYAPVRRLLKPWKNAKKLIQNWENPLAEQNLRKVIQKVATRIVTVVFGTFAHIGTHTFRVPSNTLAIQFAKRVRKGNKLLGLH